MSITCVLKQIVNINIAPIRYNYFYWLTICCCLLGIVACSLDASAQTPPTPTPTPTPTATPDPNAPLPVGGPGLLTSRQSSSPEVRAIKKTQSREEFARSFTIHGNASLDTKIALLDYVNNGELTDPIEVGKHVIIPPADFCSVQDCSVIIPEEVSMRDQVLVVTVKEMTLSNIAELLNIGLDKLVKLNPSLALQDPVPANTVFVLPGEIKKP